MSNLEKAAQVVYESCYGRNLHPGQVSSIVRGLNNAGLLMPDVPEIKHPGSWVDGLEINTADKDGEVLIEWEDESDYAYYGTQTRNLWLNRDQVLAVLAASDYAEKKKED